MTGAAKVDNFEAEIVSRRSMLAILGRILMLVACVPLLLPTGICVCKAGVSGGVSARQAAFKGRAGGSVASPCNACCTTGRCPEHVGKAASSQAGRVSQSPRPVPTDDRHMPGCPASPTAEASKWVEPTPPLAAALPPHEAVAFLFIEVVFVAARQISNPANRSSSPPLYLSHCSLVI